jgi:hypothetical protein
VIMNPDFANKILEMQKQKIESQQR